MIGRYGIAPDEALLVGDGNADMQVAENANIQAVGVSFGVFPAEELTRLGAATIIDALPELLELVGAGRPWNPPVDGAGDPLSSRPDASTGKRQPPSGIRRT